MVGKVTADFIRLDHVQSSMTVPLSGIHGEGRRTLDIAACCLP